MSAAIINFAAARQRIEALASSVHQIEIAAARIPVVHEFEFKPEATLLERLSHSLTRQELAELAHSTLEESL